MAKELTPFKSLEVMPEFGSMTIEEIDEAIARMPNAYLRILNLASKGNSIKEVCSLLVIKKTTVNTYKGINRTFKTLLNNIYNLSINLSMASLEKLASSDALDSYLNIRSLCIVDSEATASEKSVALQANTKVLELSGHIGKNADPIATINIGQILVNNLQAKPIKPQWER